MEDRKSFSNIVTIFPPDKAENEETILFKFGLKDGTVLRFAMSSQTAKHFATRLLLLTANENG
jgi:hypothetical protein